MLRSTKAIEVVSGAAFALEFEGMDDAAVNKSVALFLIAEFALAFMNMEGHCNG